MPARLHGVSTRGGAHCGIELRRMAMRRYQVGDHVSWNSEAGRVRGRIIKIHTRDFDYKGHTHRASAEDPQYEIKSDKTEHVAAHKGAVLRKLRS
jgi:hypothetical protein